MASLENGLPGQSEVVPIERGKLQKVKFGNSDMMVTEVCAGTMMWGSFNPEEQQAHEQLDALVKLGVNFVDTAELYPVGWNYGKTTESWIGDWLEQRSAAGTISREQLYIATKCNMMGMGGPDGIKKPHSYDSETMLLSCRESIGRLKCGYIDLYQIHFPSRDVNCFGAASFVFDGEKGGPKPFAIADKGTSEDFKQQVLAIKDLFDAGLIKYWGLSNENAYGITMFCTTCAQLGVPLPISCQNDFSLLNRTYESDCAEAAHRFGIVGLPYGPLSGGTLTGKYLLDSKYADSDATVGRGLDKCRHRIKEDFQPRYGNPTAMLACEKYVALAERWGLTPTELALAWARQRWYNSSIIIGTTTVRQVEECVGAFSIKELPAALISAIDLIHEEFRNPTQFYTSKDAMLEASWIKGESVTLASGVKRRKACE